MAGKTTTLVPDLAKAAPTVSTTALDYTFTIRKGVMWDTKPPCQVTAADILRGVERSCDPYKPSAALSEYETLVVGLATFCKGFAKVAPTVSAMSRYIPFPDLPSDPVHRMEAREWVLKDHADARAAHGPKLLFAHHE